MTRKLPRFALCWLVTTALWNAVLAYEGLASAFVAALLLALEVLVLLAAYWLCRREPTATAVTTTLVAACVALGVMSTAFFAWVGGNGDVLAFVLLTLYLSSALSFAWGWRTELIILVATVIVWFFASPYLTFHTPWPELGAAIMIGSVLSLAIAEGAARSFRFAYIHRAKEERTKRALEVSRDDAEHARQQAEAATRAKDEFLATVSHELRSPIAAVLTWTQTLRGSAESHQFDRALEVIERNAKAQAHLIEDLLDVSRIVSGKLHLERAGVNVGAVVRNVVDVVRASAEAKRLTVAMNVSDDVLIRGDAVRLHQVVENLVSNAIKFTPEGGRVSLTVKSTETEAEICVEDTGTGISSERLAHVFERFVQAEGASTERRGGLGLGLSIVRHIVEMHGGRVWAESPGLGRGTTFRVRLPLDRHAEVHDPSAAIPPSH